MPRRLMAKYSCSRCARTWFVDFEQGQELKDPPSFKMLLSLPGKQSVEVAYEELCRTCAKSISNYADSISKQLKGCSPKRAKKETPDGAPLLKQRSFEDAVVGNT